MRKNLSHISLIVLASLSTSAISQTTPTLNDSRVAVIERYVADLEKADYKDITRLFDKNGIVVSTSQGQVDAKEFYYAFLSEIKSANTEIHQVFVSNTDSNRLAARFHFNFKFKNGEEGSGEYIDEFVFVKNSDKLYAAYMFENEKF